MKSSIFTLLFITFASGLFASQQTKTVKMRLQSPTGNLSDAVIYFDQSISPTYNYHEDAQMVFNNVPGVPQLYTLSSDNVPCSTNGFGDLTRTEVVPLGYKVGYSGQYNLSAILLNNFDPTTIIRLYDKLNGTMIDLRQQFAQVMLDTADAPNGRFFLHVSYPAQYSSTPSNCSDNGGVISMTFDSTITWNTVQLVDDSNNIISTQNNVVGSVTFPSLSAGDYHIVLTNGQYTTTQNFHLDGDFVVAAIGTPGSTIFIKEDVTFNALVTNANHFNWDFGDGTLIVGVCNPDQVYLAPGTYTINLFCSNDKGCSSSAQATVEVMVASGVNELNSKSVSVTTIGKTVSVNMNGATISNGEIKIYNLLGQSVYGTSFNAQNELVNLEGQPSGYYLVLVKNAGKLSTKRIFLTK